MDYSYSSTNDGAREPEPGFRSISGLTRWLVWLLYVFTLMGVLGIVSSLMQLSLLSGDFTNEEATANDTRHSMVAVGTLVSMAVTMVVFGVWIVRAHRNLPHLGAERLDVKPGWALGWFFIPVASLWKPYQAMRTLWQASHAGPRWQHEDTPLLLPLWWTFWLLTHVSSRAESVFMNRADSIDALAMSTYVSLFAGVIVSVLNVLAIWLVRGVARAQAVQHDALEAAARDSEQQLVSAEVPALPG